jgi:hypothetical protein
MPKYVDKTALKSKLSRKPKVIEQVMKDEEEAS